MREEREDGASSSACSPLRGAHYSSLDVVLAPLLTPHQHHYLHRRERASSASPAARSGVHTWTFYHTLLFLLHPESSDSHKRFYSQHKAQMFQHQQVGFHLETVHLESSEVALLHFGSLGSEAASTGPGASPERACLQPASVFISSLASQVEACRNTHSETNHLPGCTSKRHSVRRL